MKLMKLLLMLTLLFIIGACQSNGSDIDYNDRSLVSEECAYLDNLDEHWQPVWCDEFDEDGLPNPDKWGYDVGGGGWGNRELQYYTNANLNNAFIEDGILNIRAINETIQGHNYTSARLVTKYRGDWEYGRIQVKAKMPEGRGTWPAVWMLPTEWRYGGWPHSGEIDIMEYVGYDPTVVHGTIHTGAYNHGLNTQIGYTKNLPTANSEFHLYEMIWEPASIRLLIDGVQFAQFGYNPETNRYIDNHEAWPFDQPFHLILNLAIGGDWGGQRGVDSDAFPTAMEVKYVRVYQKDYAGMTESPPSAVDNLRLHWTTHDTVRVAWNHATDDVQVSHYDIYANDVYKGSTSLNAYNIEGLDSNTNYTIKVIAVDFADNVSAAKSMGVSTESVRTVGERIQAQAYDGMKGINTQTTEDTSGDFNVTSIGDTDYLEYLLEVPEKGTYRISYRVASENGDGEIRLLTRSHIPHTVVEVPSTGGNQTWITLTSEEFTLNEGVFTFKILASRGGFNLNYFEIEKVN